MSDTLGEGVILAGRYRIDRVFAIGDFSVLYLTHDLRFADLGKLVILKEHIRTSPDVTMHEMVVRNFEREADLLATLSHPAIPRIYDYFRERSQSYIVMEFIEGKDLRLTLDEAEGFLPEGRITSWAISVCDVLQYLHSHRPQSIIHRDVKPQHLVLSPDDSIHIVGFAIARNYQPGQKGTLVGTSAYAAPEQFRGDASPRTDIYALGATLYHLLARQVPHFEYPPVDSEQHVRKLNPGVSMSMESIVRKAMDPNPDGRFETAKEMKLALIGLVTDEAQ